MNRLEKALFICAMLAVMAIFSPISVFAQPSSRVEPYFPDLDAQKTSSALDSSSSVPSSSPPPSSSSISSSSASIPSSSSLSSHSSSKTIQQAVANSVSPSYDKASAVTSQLDSEGGISESSSLQPSSEISLPSVGDVSDTDPLDSVVTNKESSRRLNWIGILSWACIGLGILVVLIVVFSNRRPPRDMGRKRYRRPKRSRKKRLLNDKYYRDIDRY